MKRGGPESKLDYVLRALVPYTEANLKLAFKPSLFFKELEKFDTHKARNAKSTYYRAIKDGYIEFTDDGLPVLTPKAQSKIQPIASPRFKRDVQLMITFDIPENKRHKRDRLRAILKLHKFHQVQKSVWVSKWDYRELLMLEINTSHLAEYVQLYEVHNIFPKK